jgi:hypothetical protein
MVGDWEMGIGDWCTYMVTVTWLRDRMLALNAAVFAVLWFMTGTGSALPRRRRTQWAALLLCCRARIVNGD